MSDQDLDGAVRRVQSLLELHRYADARTAARALLARNPADARLLELVVIAGIELKDHRTALDDAKRLLAACPDHAGAHALMAVTLHNRLRFKESVKAAERAVALDPTNPAYRLCLSEMLVDYAEHGISVVRQAPLRREAARQAYAALRLAPAEVDPHLALARAGLAMGDTDGAQEAVEQALAIDPQDHRAHQVLGEVALARGKIARAGDHFVAAGRLDPQDSHTMVLLRRAGGSRLFMWVLVVAVGVVVRGWIAGFPLIGLLAGLVLVGIAAVVRLVMTSRLSPGARAVLGRDRRLRRRR
jgi:tetratricopeptide (TPR) repeat protein